MLDHDLSGFASCIESCTELAWKHASPRCLSGGSSRLSAVTCNFSKHTKVERSPLSAGRMIR